MKSPKELSLLALSWPIMVEMFLQFALGTADTLMVSRISDDAVAVVGISNQFFNAVMMIFMLVASGSGILIAQRLGADKRREARTIAAMAVTITAGLGIAVSVMLSFCTGWFAQMLGVPEDIRPLALTYMGTIGSGMILTALSVALSTCVRNTGDTRSPMYIALGMNAVHVVLNGCFIFGWLGFPVWGLYGVALSTLIVRLCACLLLFRLFRHAFGTKLAWREFFSFEPRLLRDVVRIGWPMSVNSASWTFSQLAIYSVVAAMGAEQLAARTYMNTMESFAFTVGWSLAIAAQIRVAHLYGSGRLREAYASCYRALGIGLILVTLNTLIMLAFRQQILGFFTDDPWIVRTAVNLLWLNLLLQPGKMLNMALGQSINAIGDTRFAMGVSLPSMWLIAYGFGWALGLSMEWGLYGIYAGMILDEYLRGVVMWIRWRRHRRVGVFAPAFRDNNDKRALPTVTA